MEKQNLYILIAIILAIAVVAVAGEYFMYKYYSQVALENIQKNSQNSVAQKPTENKDQQQPAQNLSAEKSILSFSFQTPKSVGDIDKFDDTITVSVPGGTNITNLKPIIIISNKATISPDSGVAQNFSGPVAYLVTAQDGSTRTYIVNVNMVASSEKAITSFKLKGFYPEVAGDVNEKYHTVYAVVPDGTDLSKITPVITLSNNATINPASGLKQNFVTPIIYTVKAQDGSTQDYTIMVVTESNSG